MDGQSANLAVVKGNVSYIATRREPPERTSEEGHSVNRLRPKPNLLQMQIVEVGKSFSVTGSAITVQNVEYLFNIGIVRFVPDRFPKFLSRWRVVLNVSTKGLVYRPSVTFTVLRNPFQCVD